MLLQCTSRLCVSNSSRRRISIPPIVRRGDFCCPLHLVPVGVEHPVINPFGSESLPAKSHPQPLCQIHHLVRIFSLDPCTCCSQLLRIFYSYGISRPIQQSNRFHHRCYPTTPYPPHSP